MNDSTKIKTLNKTKSCFFQCIDFTPVSCLNSFSAIIALQYKYVLDSRPMGRGFEPHWRHCVVVLEQDTFILA